MSPPRGDTVVQQLSVAWLPSAQLVNVRGAIDRSDTWEKWLRAHSAMHTPRPTAAANAPTPTTAWTTSGTPRGLYTPSSAVQCEFNGGPYNTASQVGQCQLV